jgi:hypothetical protein
LKWGQEKGMGVSLKTENEAYSGKRMQTMGSEGGRRDVTGISMQDFLWQFPR